MKLGYVFPNSIFLSTYVKINNSLIDCDLWKVWLMFCVHSLPGLKRIWTGILAALFEHVCTCQKNVIYPKGHK